jgi:HEAT repeat protein
MISWAMLQLVLLGMTMLLLALGLATSTQRSLRLRRGRNRIANEERLRPILMQIIDEADVDTSQLSSTDIASLERLVWPMLTKVRGTTRDALVQWLQRSGAIDSAMEKIRSRNRVERAIAAEQLGAASIASAWEEIAALLDDPVRDVRVVAARSLGKLGDARATSSLLASMTGAQPVPPGIVAMSLMHLGAAAVDGLLLGLEDDSPIVRSISAQLLGMHGALAATDVLMTVVSGDADRQVRASAAESLGRIGSPAAIDPLIVATTLEADAQVRAAAAKALGMIGGRAAVGALIVLLDDPSESVGSSAAQALTVLGGDGDEALAIAASGVGVGAERAAEWMMRSRIANEARRHRGRFGAQARRKVSNG